MTVIRTFSKRRKQLSEELRGPLVAMIGVKPGETQKQAWERHIAERPQDKEAKVLIFYNQPSLGGASHV